MLVKMTRKCMLHFVSCFDGRWTRQTELSLSCPMDLTDFPYDKQECTARAVTTRGTSRQILLITGMLNSSGPESLRIDSSMCGGLCNQGFRTLSPELMAAVKVKSYGKDGANSLGWCLTDIRGASGGVSESVSDAPMLPLQFSFYIK